MKSLPFSLKENHIFIVATSVLILLLYGYGSFSLQDFSAHRYF